MDPGKNIQAGRNVILRLAERGVLNNRQVEEALAQAGIIPDAGLWLKFAKIFLLSMGVSFFLAGVVFFFAFNWQVIHKFMKLGSIAAVIVMAAGAGFLFRRESLPGRLAWMAASVMTGVFLAVYGQIYQTGADAWELFAAWAALIAGWTAAGLFPPQWLLSLTVAETGAALAMIQLHARGDAGLIRAFALLAAVNAAAYIVFEIFRLRGAEWLRPQWFTRVVATAGIGTMVLSVSVYIMEFKTALEFDFFPGFSLLVFAAFAGALVILLRRSRDRYVLAVGMFSLVVYGTCLYIKTINLRLRFDGYFAWLSTGLVIAALALGAVFAIRKISDAWSREAQIEND